eukprot:NODE_19_length_39463_cov_0.396073.p3 type:complete len:609 gc:universal NODE_19_length_39463_cov_0.396073:15860-17686(+)
MWQQRPPLPVMNLKESLDIYKTILRPLLSEQEYAVALRKINIFEKGIGMELQKRLVEYGATQDNWLDKLWLDIGYHQWRAPLMINSNWWILIKPPINPAPKGPLSRIALFSCSILHYRASVKNQAIPQEDGLCMSQYNNLFAHRHPNSKQDSLSIMNSDFIIVLIQNQCFKVPVYINNSIISPFSLYLAFQQCLSVLQGIKHSPNVPLLTSMDRDTWSVAYKHLSSIHVVNKQSLSAIEQGLFCVSLDDLTGDGYDQNLAIIAHGMDGNNRWFDKSLNVICCKDGTVGINGEHSPCDALIPSYMFHECWYMESKLPFTSTGSNVKVEHLAFVTDNVMNTFIKQAQKHASMLCSTSECGVAHFKSFGKEFMKSAKMSPDTFIQLSFQWTWYRLHRCITSTYETASTRKFHKGRTETCRTVSSACVAWVKSMDSQLSTKEGYQLMLEAAKSHKDYIIKASNGVGCDRHLFGLRLMLKQHEQVPEMFSDPSFSVANGYGLSTSQLGSKTYEYAIATGFGSAISKGYGLNYFIAPDHVKVGIECKINNEVQDIHDVYRVMRFKQAWMETMMDMKFIVENNENDRLKVPRPQGWYEEPEHEQGNSAYPRVSKL